MVTRKRSRPTMKDYGIHTSDEGLMDWSWVDEQMAKSRNYWICTTRPDGKPHAAPVWGCGSMKPSTLAQVARRARVAISRLVPMSLSIWKVAMIPSFSKAQSPKWAKQTCPCSSKLRMPMRRSILPSSPTPNPHPATSPTACIPKSSTHGSNPTSPKPPHAGSLRRINR